MHPLFIEDILNDAERAKVEKLGDADLFILFQGVQLVEEDSGDAIPLLRLEMNQVSLVLSDGVLLSFFNAPTKAIEQCKANIAAPGSRLRTSSCLWLAHMIMDKEVVLPPGVVFRTAPQEGGGGGCPPWTPPPPPLLPFQCLRLTAKMLLRRLRCQEDLN